MLFPLLTLPYAFRILEADGIGEVNFFQSILSYIILFSGLGIPLYSLREIARVRDDLRLMNITIIEILLLHLFLTAFGYAAVAVICMTVPEVQVDIPLFLVLSTSMFFTAIGCEWFYQGIEDFKFIVIRSLIVKCVFAILLFLLVKSKEDLLIYGILIVLGTVGNNIFNFLRLGKYIDKHLFKIRDLHPFRHFLPAMKIFLLNMVISLYVNLNPVMLGFMVDVVAVGYFTAASKISYMLLCFSGALQNAVLPRSSNLFQAGEYEKFKALNQKALDFLFIFTLPMTISLFILSPSVISVLFGDSYRIAALSLTILSPLVFIISLSGFFGIQMLYPQGKEKLVIWATGLGAIVNLVLDLILIPSLSYIGASIATLIAEIVVTVSMFYFGAKYLPIKRFSRHYLDCIIGCCLVGVAGMIAVNIVNDEVSKIVFVTVTGILVYTFWLLYRKNELAIYMLKLLKCKIHN